MNKQGRQATPIFEQNKFGPLLRSLSHDNIIGGIASNWENDARILQLYIALLELLFHFDSASTLSHNKGGAASIT